MSRKKKRRGGKLKFPRLSIEEVLIGLQMVSEKDSKDAHKASGLLGWYREQGDFTPKQRAYASNIIHRERRREQRKATSRTKQYSLYAISDGVYVKLGYSSNPDARLKSMQTGHAVRLVLVWVFPVGNVESEAKKAERKLHRFCSKHRKRGEWFRSECMEIVRQFEIVEKAKKERKEQEQELEIVVEALARI